MDFSQFFQSDSQNSKANHLVKELLQSVMDDQEKKPRSQEELFDAFNQKYGSVEAFVGKHLPKMIRPYEETMMEAVMNKLDKDQTPQYISVLTLAAVETVRNFHMKMMSDNVSSPFEQAEIGMKAAAIATKLHHSLPGDTMNDDITTVLALLSLINLKVAEITAYMVAQHLSEEEIDNQF